MSLIIHSAHPFGPFLYLLIVRVLFLELVQIPQQMGPTTLVLSLIAVVPTVEVRA
jgi:hypothetical protein